MFDAVNPSTESDDDRWQAWLHVEARRRLLTASFIVDVHASTYQQQQQRRTRTLDPSQKVPPIPLTGRAAALWEAKSADRWAALLAAHPEAGSPNFAPPLAVLCREDPEHRPHFDVMALLCLEMVRLPRNGPVPRASPCASPAVDFGTETDAEPCRTWQDTLHAEQLMASLFPHPITYTYLALQHTPLHDLLCVSGDSWVFCQKVLPATSFRESGRRLRTWVEQSSGVEHSAMPTVSGMNAARATVYAARAILGLLARESSTVLSDGEAVAPWIHDISDYWALFVCALVVWATSHRSRVVCDASHPDRRRSTRVTALPRPSLTLADEKAALDWLRHVADMSFARAELDADHHRGQRAAAAVLGLVRQRLEKDCVGANSRLYMEAVGVLKKLDDVPPGRSCS